MKITTNVVLDIDELNDKLHYRLICETTHSSLWNTGKIKRAFNSEFTEEEKVVVEQIRKKSHRWYLHSLPKELTVTMSSDEFKIWKKLKNFCVKYCTI